MSERSVESVLGEVERELSGPAWMRVRGDAGATWFGPFATSVALAVGVRPIEHADSVVRVDDDGLFSANVIVFTDKTVVFADVAGAMGASDHVKSLVVARPRAGLTQLTIAGAVSASGSGGGDGEGGWPGDFTVTATWDHGAKVTLPLGRIELVEQRRRFMALYTALSAALGE